jgi:hypothetical protein
MHVSLYMYPSPADMQKESNVHCVEAEDQAQTDVVLFSVLSRLGTVYLQSFLLVPQKLVPLFM